MNSRHRKFCEGVVAGKTAGQAYIDAGYDSQGKAAITNASRLLTNDNIKQRISNMMDKTESNTIKTVKERKEMLSRIMDNNEDSDGNTAIRASAELSKMDGAYEPERQEVDLNIIIGGDANG